MEGQLEAIEAVSSRRPSNSTSPRTSSWKRLEKNWSQLQVGHHGSYSVERLELLHEYCQATSFRRVLLVCLLTPAPALLVAVVLECLPLRSPSEGWADNWLFWIRVGVMLMFIIPVGAWQLNLFVPDHNISKYQQFNANLLLLFHCEYLVLVEYVECIVPIIFLVYKSVLEQLPNVVYYPGGAGKWGAAAVTNLVVFVVLEIGSLVLLHIFLQQKFAFSPLYQLAFVLETQIHAVQATLFSLTLFVLPYQLAHLGVDFTFHFQWLEE
ncbi:hypothetical protein PF003_g30474 [Phytophthora fragariae]|nr:hypothetical protein PF003_g30474 [Phytophthora fragariae]